VNCAPPLPRPARGPRRWMGTRCNILAARSRYPRPHPEERRRRVSKDGGGLVRDGASRLLTMRPIEIVKGPRRAGKRPTAALQRLQLPA
jgi:hypothetical protein